MTYADLLRTLEELDINDVAIRIKNYGLLFIKSLSNPDKENEITVRYTKATQDEIPADALTVFEIYDRLATIVNDAEKVPQKYNFKKTKS